MRLRSAVEQVPPRTASALDEDTIRNLAWFRYNLRKFLRFSEKAARQCGVTPQQHQLMLGVAGYTGRGWATVSELAEFLQERHNSVVGLVDRAAQCGLVRKEHDTSDRRFVFVHLTRHGEQMLAKLTEMHSEEVGHARETLLKPPKVPPQTLAFKKRSSGAE
ncbi:MarR family winged helix-turn-helix transcriptional regulator [Edaphobacter acidisoli]|uniref:MarR family winged helix-turn-helix transcriptional regulator n=1 Tax=Edaphobacter acidisoli TaxID=2040573 RepID=UPI001665F9D3|nr:MarR family transcriptional regulator [Edaphobacter acidisoli]